MKVATCGNIQFAFQLKEFLKNTDIEVTSFIAENVTEKWEGIRFLSFLEFKHEFQNKLIDGIIIADDPHSTFTRKIITFLKWHRISKIGVVIIKSIQNSIYWLDSDKSYMPYLETGVIKSCNLNCKACANFSPLFNDDDDPYLIDDFKRDIKTVSESFDIIKFRLLGAEPFKKDNLIDFIELSRYYLPKTNIHVVTNGLLIPNTKQEVFDSIKRNNVIVDISMYPPTIKLFDKIREILIHNQIPFEYANGDVIREFFTRLTLNNNNNPQVAQDICLAKNCRSIMNGKIYKCPFDALLYQFKEKFNVKNLPEHMGVDIYSPNLTLLMDKLDEPIELCSYCAEKPKLIPWEASNHHTMEEWLN